MTSKGLVQRFCQCVRGDLMAHHDTDDGIAEVLARLDAQQVDCRSLCPSEPQQISVCRHLPKALEQARAIYPDLTQAVEQLLPYLRWARAPEGGSEPTLPGYMTDFGYTPILGAGGLIETDDFALGLFLIGPHQHYPEHAHDAPELYWLLSGPVDFHFGDNTWCAHDAGTTIWNPARKPHATHTREIPMLVIWCWTQDVNGAYFLLGKQIEVL